MAAWSAQIGSISVMMTRAPWPRSDSAQPLPTSPYPQTTATLPPISTSVPRLMPSISECRQPYLLSNLDLVTESLTLIAGNSSEPARAISYSRCTPVVVSSVTPTMSPRPPSTCPATPPASARSSAEDHVPLVGVIVGRGRDPARLLVLRALVHQHGRVAAVVQQHVRAVVAIGPGQRLLGAPPVLLQALALPGEDGDALRGVRGAAGADRRSRRPRGPGWRRCCSWPSGPARRAR